MINGFVKNFTDLGETLSATGSTKDINQTVRMIGITDDAYDTAAIGIPKK
ncbi:hypothetical protein MGH68_16885 [Erysipelothrix sp. D19-032]